MLVNRPYWQSLIEKAWQDKNVIWLMGIRRIGKTSLCQSLADMEYFDCERPRVRQLLEDPEGFLEAKRNKRIILDEIHRLENPSEILKIAADHYKSVKIIATGSSTLGASAKFKDTLTDRKKEIWLTPLLLEEMSLFGANDIHHRFLFGGLPALFASKNIPDEAFGNWIDAYWAKDIQELFKVDKYQSFKQFTELVLAYSGGIFEATKFANACVIDRRTISSYLNILEETFVAHVIRPYATHKPNEIIKAPKVYGFDTGFVCYTKGWQEIKREDTGLLWEHCVLNELHGHLRSRKINYWRDKQGHEIDFVIANRVDNSLTVIECKFKLLQKQLDQSGLTNIAKNIEVFRQLYPKGENLIVAYDIDEPFERKFGSLTLSFVNAKDLKSKLKR